jgi:hypothetical protein
VDVDDKPVRAIYEHCCSVYQAMLDESTVHDATSDGGDSWQETIYEGHLTKLFQEQGMSPPYYTTIRDLLIKMGCMEQLRRGGGNAKSRWRLVKPPTEELFQTADAMVKRPSGRVAMLEQGLTQAIKRIQRLEDALGIPSGV